ncbi:hypothetical protein CRG98_009026 [Punica granatum]|uniref:Transposase MuDR plant domain-containing protein n=1 Tax=Punica granatum TaxID=22663 RepID=A0A2I0KPW1_PUNGR|nr:hypothetical protein CRG98_009026 [Punica granatum]
MEGSSANGTSIAPATSSTGGGGSAAAVGASISVANIEEEHICEGYETDELKTIHDEDLEDESIKREVDFVKNDTERVRAVCIKRDLDSKGKGKGKGNKKDNKPNGCPWVISCLENKAIKVFQVKTFYSEHTCAIRMTNKLATRECIVPRLVPLIRIQIDIAGHVAYDYMIHRYGVKMNDAMVSRALKLAYEICEGQEKEQYAKLCDSSNSDWFAMHTIHS